MQTKVVTIKNRFSFIDVLKLNSDNFVISPNGQKSFNCSLKETVNNLYLLGINKKEIELGIENLVYSDHLKIAFSLSGNFLGSY